MAFQAIGWLVGLRLGKKRENQPLSQLRRPKPPRSQKDVPKPLNPLCCLGTPKASAREGHPQRSKKLAGWPSKLWGGIYGCGRRERGGGNRSDSKPTDPNRWSLGVVLPIDLVQTAVGVEGDLEHPRQR